MQNPLSSTYSDWHAYVWAKVCASRSPSGKAFWKVPLSCGVNSSFTSKKGTAADTGIYYRLWNFLSSSNHCFFGKQSIHKHRRERLGCGHRLLPPPLSCFFAPIPAGPPVLPAFYHQVKKGLLLWKLWVYDSLLALWGALAVSTITGGICTSCKGVFVSFKAWHKFRI